MLKRLTQSGLQSLIDSIRRAVEPRLGEGRLADYIPELGKVDPKKLGIVVATVTGDFASTGDVEELFSIQSISKVFTLTMALGKVGDILWERVGREPSGSSFDSIIQLEHNRGIRFVRFLADDESVVIDPAVARSETEAGYRNRALANYMRAFGNLHHPVDWTLGVYFHQCAIAMNCRQLARAGLFLANQGEVPAPAAKVVSPRRARRINSLMLTCGQYDGSGDFAYRVGLPGKSGVGGGVLAIVPGVASIAVWSPALNEQGNSLIGTQVLEQLAARTEWSIF